MFLVTLDFDAVLLAGGRASRLGGSDKTAFTVSGSTLLERAVEAAQDARHSVVVGLRDGTAPPSGVILTREDPPWSGPVAALEAGLDALRSSPAPLTLVLACDLPRAPEAVATLRRAAGIDPRDGVIAVDDEERRQPLLALYRSAALRDRLDVLALAGPVAGLSFRRFLEGLDLVEMHVPSDLSADVDTPEDAARLGVGGAPGRTPG